MDETRFAERLPSNQLEKLKVLEWQQQIQGSDPQNSFLRGYSELLVQLPTKRQ